MSDDREEETVDLSTEGYTSVQHPGPAFRPIPEFTFDVPPGWIVSDFAEALCFVGTPAALDGPWSNVFLQHERVLPTTALEEVAVESWDQTLVDFPDAIVIDERLFEFEQYHYVRESELTLVDERVTRIDSYWFGPDVDHPTVDLFHLIGLHPVGAGEDRTVEYLKILGSFRFASIGDQDQSGASVEGTTARPRLRTPRRRRQALVGRTGTTKDAAD